jgi:hypothetical protein
MFLGDEIRVKVRRETKPEVSPGGGGGGAVSRRDKLGEFGLDNFIHSKMEHIINRLTSF